MSFLVRRIPFTSLFFAATLVVFSLFFASFAYAGGEGSSSGGNNDPKSNGGTLNSGSNVTVTGVGGPKSEEGGSNPGWGGTVVGGAIIDEKIDGSSSNYQGGTRVGYDLYGNPVYDNNGYVYTIESGGDGSHTTVTSAGCFDANTKEPVSCDPPCTVDDFGNSSCDPEPPAPEDCTGPADLVITDITLVGEGANKVTDADGKTYYEVKEGKSYKPRVRIENQGCTSTSLRTTTTNTAVNSNDTKFWTSVTTVMTDTLSDMINPTADILKGLIDSLISAIWGLNNTSDTADTATSYAGCLNGDKLMPHGTKTNTYIDESGSEQGIVDAYFECVNGSWEIKTTDWSPSGGGGVPNKGWSLKDVSTVYKQSIDPNPNIADDEYTVYSITLTNDKKYSVSVGGRGFDYEAAFRQVGYTGDVNALMGKAVETGATTGTDVSTTYGGCYSGDKLYSHGDRAKDYIIDETGEKVYVVDGYYVCADGTWEVISTYPEATVGCYDGRKGKYEPVGKRTTHYVDEKGVTYGITDGEFECTESGWLEVSTVSVFETINGQEAQLIKTVYAQKESGGKSSSGGGSSSSGDKSGDSSSKSSSGGSSGSGDKSGGSIYSGSTVGTKPTEGGYTGGGSIPDTKIDAELSNYQGGTMVGYDNQGNPVYDNNGYVYTVDSGGDGGDGGSYVTPGTGTYVDPGTPNVNVNFNNRHYPLRVRVDFNNDGSFNPAQYLDTNRPLDPDRGTWVILHDYTLQFTEGEHRLDAYVDVPGDGDSGNPGCGDAIGCIDEISETNNEGDILIRAVAADNSGSGLSALLQARAETESSYSGADREVPADTDIYLSWDSNNADYCVGTPGNFTDSIVAGLHRAVSGTTENLSRNFTPFRLSAGESQTYNLTCGTIEGSTVLSTLTLTGVDSSLVPPDIDAGADGGPLIDGPLIVRYGEEVTIAWDPNGNIDCILSNNLSEYDANTANNIEMEVTAESVYTIECSGGSDSVRVQVLPRIEET